MQPGAAPYPHLPADAAMAELIRLADLTARPDVLRECSALLSLLPSALVDANESPNARARVFRRVLLAVLEAERREPSHPKNYVMAAAELLALPDPGTTNLDLRRENAGRRLRPKITTARRVMDHVEPMMNAWLHALLDFLEDETKVRTLARQLRPTPVIPPQDSSRTGDDRRDRAAVARRRLGRLSEQMAAELDVASVADGGHVERRLSTDLYVTRTHERDVLATLLPDGPPSAVVVSGEAGHGKSSMLWGLYRAFHEDWGIEAYLLNALWLVDPGSSASAPLIPGDELMRALSGVHAEGRTSAVLIDTADLLLHHEADRRRLLDFCDLAMEAGGHVVVTSRPDEARSLPREIFRHVGLQPYDDRELAEAVTRHVRAYCPDAPPYPQEEKISLILGAVARGLPTLEICRSPLLLRLLFDLYAPDFPALELDVSGLYRLYWRRRVVADARSEVAPGGQAGRDLSVPAEQAGLSLLAAGRTELEPEILLRYMATVAGSWRTSAPELGLEDAVTSLARRGVMVRSRLGVRFFHQTLFEYAAALGLLERDGQRAVGFLAAHVLEHPDDLFVGAVLEQMLVLAAADPMLVGHVEQVLTTLADSGLVALQRAALGVVAYRPELAAVAQHLIRSVDPAAVRRYAYIAPSVATAKVADLLVVLGYAWDRDPHCRMAVLEALERLAAREPAAVLGMLRKLEVGGYVQGLPKDAGPALQLYARLLCALASADTAWATDELVAHLEFLLNRAKGRDLPLYVLDLIARHWPVLGSQHLADGVQALVLSAQERHDAGRSAMREALGRILALSWRARPDTAAWWPGLLDEVCRTLEATDQDTLAHARLVGMVEWLRADPLDVPLLELTVRRLMALSGPSAPFAIAREALLPRLLGDERPAALIAFDPVLRRLSGLPAPGSKPPVGPQLWASVVRKCLHDVNPPEQIARLLSGLPKLEGTDLWLADDGAALLLVQAAVGGHGPARAALAALKRDPTAVPPMVQKIVSYDIYAWLDRDYELLPLLVDLSHARQTARPLGDVVKEHGTQIRDQLASLSAELRHLIDLLLGARSGPQQEEGANLWLMLDALRAVPSPELDELVNWTKRLASAKATANLYRLTGQAAIAGRLPMEGAERLLRSRFGVSGDPPMLLRPGKGNADVVALFAREAWLNLMTQAWPLDEVDLHFVVDVAAAERTDSACSARSVT
ncbi:hypothetical protein [Pseudofrankia sp. BMG5.36]|uniref:hypothetical protein n=1 Tax=Pseudofrankia sp. BMG5.36 TaxID=1834512 RepID=UPI0008DAEADA|nr:hypothetical protein [Pseudofrankia sp. BMG5.36]OHV61399.1 hypothetical protein BCD48_39730 [Pseudofrankia sp. BMG5.36]